MPKVPDNEGVLPPLSRTIAFSAAGGGFGGALLAIVVAKILQGPCCCNDTVSSAAAATDLNRPMMVAEATIPRN